MAKRPELPEHLIETWRDYQRVAKSRPYLAGGMSQPAPMPIPFDVLDRYARRFGPHHVDAFERWLYLIEAMDAAWRERQQARQG